MFYESNQIAIYKKVRIIPLYTEHKKSLHSQNDAMKKFLYMIYLKCLLCLPIIIE